MTSACIACGNANWRNLPTLADAMCSDGKCVGLPLRKTSCSQCGLVRHSDDLVQQAIAGLFETNYQLHAAPPNAFDLARAKVYADWLQPHLGDSKRLFEIGCGNGALLAALQQADPTLQLAGIEPNPAAAQIASAQGFAVQTGLFDGSNKPDALYDAVLSVNVLEHVCDPRGFLRAMQSWIKADGNLLLICPDGEQASTELLIADHLHTFPRRALHSLLQQSGWKVINQPAAPPALAGFQLVIAKRSEAFEPVADSDIETLQQQRQTLLAGWQTLDDALCRDAIEDDLGIFGAGEFAMLLRCYAPNFWQRVRFITGDAPPAPGLFHQPWRPLSELQANAPIYVATRIEVQSAILARLATLGYAGRPVNPQAS